MKKFKVTMQVREKDGSIHTIERTATCCHHQQVIEWYGLNEPDIVWCKVVEVK